MKPLMSMLDHVTSLCEIGHNVHVIVDTTVIWEPDLREVLANRFFCSRFFCFNPL